MCLLRSHDNGLFPPEEEKSPTVAGKNDAKSPTRLQWDDLLNFCEKVMKCGRFDRVRCGDLQAAFHCSYACVSKRRNHRKAHRPAACFNLPSDSRATCRRRMSIIAGRNEARCRQKCRQYFFKWPETLSFFGQQCVGVQVRKWDNWGCGRGCTWPQGQRLQPNLSLYRTSLTT